MFINVDFPAPFSPKIACTSPLSTFIFILWFALSSPKDLQISFISIEIFFTTTPPNGYINLRHIIVFLFTYLLVAPLTRAPSGIFHISSLVRVCPSLQKTVPSEKIISPEYGANVPAFISSAFAFTKSWTS